MLYDWILNSFSYYSTQVFKLICLLSRTPPELIELLISLEEKAAESYPPDTMASLSEDETELKLNSFFPSLPIQRCRGTYEMDLKGCRRAATTATKNQEATLVYCLECFASFVNMVFKSIFPFSTKKKKSCHIMSCSL